MKSKPNSKLIAGICVSPGKVTGRLRFYQRDIKYKKTDIVLLNEWVTSNVSYLKNAGGLVSSKGGITCHASIIAREYGIPCLVAVKNLDLIKSGAKLELNATSEAVKIL